MPLQSNTTDRAIFTVAPHDNGWAVLFEGDVFDPSRDKAEAVASANRRARACHDAGRPVQIRVDGEVSFAERGVLVRRRGD